MTNANREIIEAINDRSAHGIAEALEALGVSVTKCGAYGATDEGCDVAGWVVRFDGDNAIEPDELADIVDMTARIA